MYVDQERAPNPVKSEQIFVSMCVGRAWERGWMDQDETTELSDRIEVVMKHSAKAWRIYQAAAAAYADSLTRPQVAPTPDVVFIPDPPAGIPDVDRATTLAILMDRITAAQNTAELRAAANDAKTFGLTPDEKPMFINAYDERQSMLNNPVPHSEVHLAGTQPALPTMDRNPQYTEDPEASH